MGSGKELREAARLMRERALAATPGPWRFGDDQLIAGVSGIKGPGTCAYCHIGEPVWVGKRGINGEKMLAHVHRDESPWQHGIYAERAEGHLNVVNDTDEYGYMKDGDAKHIASWHPAVALAVADWLDHEAAVADQYAEQGVEYPAYPQQHDALSVARAYLGVTP